ncbi:uridine nucleosidase [Candidatus Moduliflexus flocculans]|uniref:Uridine nucleosidase n=1 Tax=Candidatus Moduliflexus flocculans TaxID=1499966 RepID=A0A0S6VZN7_9BACT|nr:uridine nucleosidase [Candidatus Moduliflexus flocculans]
MKKIPVILDCDPGHDDAVAIVLAARSPEIELVGITCVAGNVEVEQTAANALKVCGLAGLRTVPVFKGMAQPLLNELLTAEHIHGKSGLDGAELPPTDLTVQPTHAVDFLIEKIFTFPHEMTIIAIGPLTNIAMAILREPRITELTKQIVLMGGAMGMGNVTPSAEFNIYVDPEAARIVFNSGIPLTMIGLDVTHQVLVSRDIIEQIRQNGTSLAHTFASLLAWYNASLNALSGELAAMHDPCAVAMVCDPSLIATELMRVDIETRGEFTRGRTVCARGFSAGRMPNARVAVGINAPRVWKMLIERLR